MNMQINCQYFLQVISHYRMKLRAFCDILEKIATTRFAAKWDNVGLLVEPADCVGSKKLIHPIIGILRDSGEKSSQRDELLFLRVFYAHH